MGSGGFFAAKLRSGVLFEIYSRTGNAEAGKLALAQYKQAREAWATMAARANSVYRPDITYGDIPMRRGNWTDRLAGIDKDIAAMESKLQTPPASTGSEQIRAAIQAATGRPNRPSVHCVHTPPASFHPGQPLPLSLATHETPGTVHLYYRHVNQAERWLSVEMRRDHSGYSAAIPGDYTNSVFPLQYYFDFSTEPMRRGCIPPSTQRFRISLTMRSQRGVVPDLLMGRVSLQS